MIGSRVLNITCTSKSPRVSVKSADALPIPPHVDFTGLGWGEMRAQGGSDARHRLSAIPNPGHATTLPEELLKTDASPLCYLRSYN